MKAIVVTGPTATGKTRLAIQLARRFKGEIISADSRQVYRGMDIGTGKDLAEYGTGKDAVPHHLIDIVSPLDEYNLSRFLADASRALREIVALHHLPFIVGGTPLYVHALLRSYDLPGGAPDPEFRASVAGLPTHELVQRLAQRSPSVYRRTDITQRKRVIRALEIANNRSISAGDLAAVPKLDALILAPYYTRQEVHRRIEQRLRARLKGGMLDEVRRLHAQGVSWDKMEYFGLEYRYAARHLRGELDEEEFFIKLFTQIRRFCKSQDAWFRKMEREGHLIHWLPGSDSAMASDLVARFLGNQPLQAPVLRISDILYGPKSQ
jgi:tRNA dimethylallyltransferase